MDKYDSGLCIIYWYKPQDATAMLAAMVSKVVFMQSFITIVLLI